MNLVFPIVGLGRFIPEKEISRFVQSLPDGAKVGLVYDNANTYDRYSIQAWIDLSVDGEIKPTPIGYVSSDFAPMIRANYPDNSPLFAYVVHPDTSIPNETYFEVEMELEQLTLPIIPTRINLDSIANIPLPMTCPERQVMWQEIMDYSQTQITPEGVLALAQRSASLFGHSLSGEERTAYTLLSTMLAYVQGLWTDLSNAVMEQRLELDGLHREAFRTPEQCARIMDKEMQTYKESLTAFFDQYAAVLASGLTTREQEIDHHVQWLKDLPNNLFAWLKDKPTLASKLYYERFSMEELYAIYLHVLCLDWLRAKGKSKLVVDDSLQQRMDQFAYWHPYATPREKRLAVQRMQETLSGKGRYPVADLAKVIKDLQDKNIIARGTIFVKFIAAINALLATDLKPNSLAKHFRKFY